MATVSLTQMRDALRVLQEREAVRRCGLRGAQAELLEAHLAALLDLVEWIGPRADQVRALRLPAERGGGFA